MKILVEGLQERYEKNMPDFAKELPVELIFRRRGTPIPELAEAGAEAEVLCVDAITPVPRALIEALPKLRMIHSEGVAYNSIDIEAARERGVYVCHSPGINSSAVAEQTIMLMLMLTRLGLTGDRAVREGRQMEMKEATILAGIPELGEHTVGLIGFGDIGQATAKRLAPFGCPVYYYAPHRRSPEVEAECHAEYLPQDELLARSDIVCLLCAVNDQTRGMVNRAFLSKMKPTAYLVNTGRGDLVNNEDLRAAIIDGTIAGMALDTIFPEPTPGDHPLVDLPPQVRDKVVYSPHLGGITGGSFRRSHQNMWNSIRLLIQGQRPNYIVNGL